MDRVNILVVDDLPGQRLTIEAALAELGQNVIAVGSGREALKFLLEGEAAVILLDVNMPEMDGFETAALIRHRPRSATIPIIFLTADTDELQAARGYALGAVDYLICPFLPDVLRTKVKVFVELSRAQERIKRQSEQRIALSRAQAARAAAEEQSRRLRLLTEASGIFTRSLEGAPFVGDLLQWLVPRLADVAAIALLDGPQLATTWVGGTLAPVGALEPRVDPLPHADLARALERCAANGGPAVWPAGADFPLHGVAVPLLLRGQCFGALGIARAEPAPAYAAEDVELMEFIGWRAAMAIDNLRLYAELQERDRRKDEFLAMLSHELRNPLGAITTAVHLLGSDRLDGPGARHASDVIARQAAHLTHMVDDLLEVSRVTAGRITLSVRPVDMRGVVDRVLEALSISGNLDRHDVTASGEGVTVLADEARLDQIVSNLVTNAIKYTDAGGAIHIDIAADADMGVLEVRDTGIGIAPELLPDIFEVFVQGRQSLDRGAGGLGLGLALVRKLTELQHGRVEAASEGPGSGSTFRVRIPRVDAAPLAPLARVAARPAAPLSVLVVEDHSDARAMLTTLLELRGHEVHEAATGHEALDVAARVRPQLALVDVGLPGIDGYEVARQLRASSRHPIMLVAVTGYSQAEDRRRALDSGFDAHLVKPVQPERLDQLLSRAGPRREAVGA